ncbi:WXG100 family type VII secretion target [Nonomuraea turkmeniaca]|uniref:WXG100 family type VII secretion target n=1 Tax=Nonomuraea turkmeniaca TaxID=103838 RepID=A0A5S4FK11_9ACTN|nr:WXG100 family type VII secretion target [Nonomuraea turkmeniaca]TMR20939.1 WXG100 family type VII secretion target [Nonomuraea turkmeniaca]
MTVIGGEIPQLHALNASFQRQAGTVDALLRDLGNELAGTYWRGGAADRFRTSWSGEYEPALRRLSAALVEAATEVRRRADALEQAGS